MTFSSGYSASVTSRTRNCFEWLRISRFSTRSMEKISLTKANSPDWVVINGISARQLYEALAELRQRGVVQARGRFRAILPQAIANTLAAHALERIPPSSFRSILRKAAA